MADAELRQKFRTFSSIIAANLKPIFSFQIQNVDAFGPWIHSACLPMFKLIMYWTVHY